jgi:hypothetical protein
MAYTSGTWARQARADAAAGGGRRQESKDLCAVRQPQRQQDVLCCQQQRDVAAHAEPTQALLRSHRRRSVPPVPRL